MRKLISIVKVNFANVLTYRGDIFFYSLSSITLSLVVLLTWLATIESGNSDALSSQSFIQYYLVLMIVSIWIGAWSSYFVSNSIRNGKISPFLLKPAPYMFHQIGNNIAEKLFKTLYSTPIVMFLFYYFKTTLPILGFWQWIYFLLSWVLAAVISFTLDICIGLTAFWIDESLSIEDFYGALAFLFSGRLIPLFTLPTLVQETANFLPFRYSLSLPVEIAIGKIPHQQIVSLLTIQFFWFIAAITLLLIMWNKGLKRYSSVGA